MRTLVVAFTFSTLALNGCAPSAPAGTSIARTGSLAESGGAEVCAPPPEGQPAPRNAPRLTWSDILSWYDCNPHRWWMQRPLTPGLGSASTSECDQYPTAPSDAMYAVLSAYMLTKNEKFRFEAERQLAYAHSRQNADHLLVHYPDDGAGATNCTDPSGPHDYVARDYQARQIYNFYFAYRALGEPLYLRWADDLAAAMLAVLPLGAPTLSLLSGERNLAALGYRDGLDMDSGKPNTPTQQTFSAIYTSARGIWSGAPAPYTDTGFTIDPNQNAELAMAFWALAHEPASRFRGDARALRIGRDGMALAISLQAADPTRPYLANVAKCPGDDFEDAGKKDCVVPARGALALRQVESWDWDETYGAYTGFSVAMAEAMGGAGSPAWTDFLQGEADWLAPVSRSPVNVCSRRYYPHHSTLDFYSSPRANRGELWQYRLPVLFFGSRDPNVAGRCTAVSSGSEADSPNAALQAFLETLSTTSYSAAGACDEGPNGFDYRYGAAVYYFYLSMLGMPSDCYLPPMESLSAALPAEDEDSFFLPRGGQRLVKVDGVVAASDPGTLAGGHSVWKGEQPFDGPGVTLLGTAAAGSNVLVALDVAGHGRVVKYDASAAGNTMFNVQGDGITSLNGYSKHILGYQDYEGQLVGVSADAQNVWVAIAGTGGGGRVVRYAGSGSTGASMFNVQGDGVTPIVGFSRQIIGYQDFESPIERLASDGSQLYVALAKRRLLRYDIAGMGAGGSMLMCLPDGTTPVTGKDASGTPWATRFAAQRMGYQDFDGSLTGLASAGGYLYVALSFTDSNRAGRVIRFGKPGTGSGSSMFYADVTGTRALAGWEAAFASENVDWQDYTNRVSDLSYHGSYVYVTTTGHQIGAYDASNPVTYMIKYHHHTAKGSGDGSMWRVGVDGVTRTFCVAHCTSPEGDADYPMSMIEFVQF